MAKYRKVTTDNITFYRQAFLYATSTIFVRYVDIYIVSKMSTLLLTFLDFPR